MYLQICRVSWNDEKKLNNCFNLENVINLKNQHQCLYHVNFPEESFFEDFFKTYERRLQERLKDHNGIDHIAEAL